MFLFLNVKPSKLLFSWLVEAELSTCSNSQHILPRSIYLSHRFSFHTLGEDYALIHRHQVDICGEEIKVRKQAEISAFSSGGPGNTAAAAGSSKDFPHEIFDVIIHLPLMMVIFQFVKQHYLLVEILHEIHEKVVELVKLNSLTLVETNDSDQAGGSREPKTSVHFL